MVKKFTIALLLFACASGFWLSSKQPVADRNWAPEMSRLAGVNQQNDRVQIDNLRSWTWRANTKTTRNWVPFSFDINEVRGLRFYIEAFPVYSGIAHTFLIFEFSEESGYAPIGVSVEARREVEENFSTIGGIFRKFELIYIWGTEKDLVSQSWSINERQRGYQLDVSPQQAKFVLQTMLAKTAKLEKTPRFYNSLFHNCTSELAQSINEQAPESIPWDLSYILTGYTDDFLHEKGFISALVTDTDIAIREAGLREAVNTAIEFAPANFSRLIRKPTH